MARFSRAMLSVNVMPLGQTAVQLNCVWHRQTPPRSSLRTSTRSFTATSRGSIRRRWALCGVRGGWRDEAERLRLGTGGRTLRLAPLPRMEEGSGRPPQSLPPGRIGERRGGRGAPPPHPPPLILEGGVVHVAPLPNLP